MKRRWPSWCRRRSRRPSQPRSSGSRPSCPGPLCELAGRSKAKSSGRPPASVGAEPGTTIQRRSAGSSVRRPRGFCGDMTGWSVRSPAASIPLSSPPLRRAPGSIFPGFTTGPRPPRGMNAPTRWRWRNGMICDLRLSLLLNTPCASTTWLRRRTARARPCRGPTPPMSPRPCGVWPRSARAAG